jgi:hypothetical protein
MCLVRGKSCGRRGRMSAGSPCISVSWSWLGQGVARVADRADEVDLPAQRQHVPIRKVHASS